MCQAQAGDFLPAERAFHRALQLAPGHPLILANFGEMLRRAGQAEPAMKQFQLAVKQTGHPVSAWLGLGRCAFQAGDIAVAVGAIERYLQEKPRSALAWHELGRAHRVREDYESAREAFVRAVELAPEMPAYAFSLGVCERLLGHPKQALERYRQVKMRGGGSTELEHARIGALLDCGKSEEALQATQTLIEADPDFLPAYNTMADLLWEYGGEAAEDPADFIGRAVDADPDNRELRLALAQFLLKARRAERAADVLAELRRDQDHPDLLLLHANALEMSNRCEQAGALYRRLHEQLGDRRVDFLNAYTRHLLRSGQWQRAADRASAAIRVAPDDQEAWAYLGTAWRLLGDAREHWLCDYEHTIAFLEVPPPAEFTDLEDFLNTLTGVLNQYHRAGREPIQQSLRRGSQTAGRLFGRSDPVLQATQGALSATIQAWLQHWPKTQEHPFFSRNSGRIRYTGSWSVKLWQSGNHVSHIHPEGWISSAFYVLLPPSVNDASEADTTRAGWIHFGQPPDELELDLEPRRWVRPKPGHLALFPSYMWHGTVPFSDDAPRMTIAFDMRPAFARH